jgi:hypothetical protein
MAIGHIGGDGQKRTLHAHTAGDGQKNTLHVHTLLLVVLNV